jgi:hypothetical protein
MPNPSLTAATPSQEPFGASALLGAGFRAAVARWPLVLALWAVEGVWSSAPRLVRRAAGLAPTFPLHSPAWFAQGLLLAIVSAGLAALTLRLFLVPGRGWWRPGRGFWICAGLLLLAGLGASAQTLLTLHGRPSRDLGLLLQQQALMYGSLLVLDWIYVRLLLWPIGALVGEPGMTPGRSWALMRGQVAGFVVAVVVLNLPLVLMTGLCCRQRPDPAPAAGAGSDLAVDRHRRPRPAGADPAARHGRRPLPGAGGGSGHSLTRANPGLLADLSLS